MLTRLKNLFSRTKQPNWLNAYAFNIASQTGEDGIINQIIRLMGARNRWCVEVGAWDGRLYSNTRQLLVDQQWSGVLLESDPQKFQELQVTYRDLPAAHCLQARVDFQGAQALDNLLAATPVPADFDFLSIDIDGADYHIWAALKNYRPRLVVIEFNPSVPLAMEFVQPADLTLQQGAGLLSLVRLGQQKGYELVATTTWNAFFVRQEDFAKLRIKAGQNTPANLHANQWAQTHLIQFYDGTLRMAGRKDFIWRSGPMAPQDLGGAQWL